MRHQDYNGWTNWETWNFAIWMNEDPITYARALEDTYDAAERTADRQEAVEALAATWLERAITEATRQTGTASVYCDLLLSSIQEINFDEIAEVYLDNIPVNEAWSS